jgi:hypothetical protein
VSLILKRNGLRDPDHRMTSAPSWSLPPGWGSADIRLYGARHVFL